MFPFNWPEEGLVPKDFMQFELQFYRTICYFLPCESVHFVSGEQFAAADRCKEKDDGDYPEIWKAGVNLVRKGRQPVVNEGGSLLFLPVWQNEKVVAVAVLSGGASIKYGEYSAEWLHERSRLISRELRRTKQWAFDPESGLLTGRQLRENIETLLQMEVKAATPKEENLGYGKGEQILGAFWSVFLLEIFPKASNSGQSSADIARAGACLHSFVGDMVPLNHFGSGLFGMMWNSDNREEFRNLGYSLLRKLKRQNFSRVYIGIAPVTPSEGGGNRNNYSQLADLIMTDAWMSLKEARRRGPFALCSASGGMAERTFRKPGALIISGLQKLWRTSRKFSIVFIKADCGVVTDGNFPKRVCSLVGEEGVVFAENNIEAFIYLPAMDGPESLAWLASFRGKIAKLGGATYSMGVAAFPCAGFSKAEIPINARKALVHTAFYGPNTATVFDGVTLNISGDVYYNEGDLRSAVKEYKRGLTIDPGNINLMNSLAVIYAQVNRYNLAIPLLEEVLQRDPKDFMALFNLGFAYLRKKDQVNSLKYFEKALAVDGKYFDLLLQLGQIYCTTGKYQKAVDLLSKAEKTGSVSPSLAEGKSWQTNDAGGPGKDIGRGLIFMHLGQAYQGIGAKKEAMGYFQRAIGYNPRDAESLSRLGQLYLEEKQGNDIALSLCRQAVLIEESNPLFWLRLAQVHVAMKNRSEAVKFLQRCLTFDKKNTDALLMLGGLYKKMGQKHKAALTYKRVLKLDQKNSQALRALK